MYKRLCVLLPFLAGGLPAANAQLLRDGNFDTLPVGILPDCGMAAGHWYFRQDFAINWCEVNAADTQIVPTSSFQPGATGNSLAQRTNSGSTVVIANDFPKVVVAVPGQILVVDFDIWVVTTTPNVGGGMVFLCESTLNRRGPFCYWGDDGKLYTTYVNTPPPPCHTEFVLDYPRGRWQHVRYVVDLNQDNWDLWWWLDGQTPVKYLDHRAFFPPPSGTISGLDALCFGRFSNNAQACGGGAFPETSSYFDNGAVFEAPDCNGNRWPDVQDIVSGFSQDLNHNGIPDECECFANCDGSTAAPVLNVNDFICFQTRFAQQDPSANCDGSSTPPVLNVNDFICFQTAYAAGCP